MCVETARYSRSLVSPSSTVPIFETEFDVLLTLPLSLSLARRSVCSDCDILWYTYLHNAHM